MIPEDQREGLPGPVVFSRDKKDPQPVYFTSAFHALHCLVRSSPLPNNKPCLSACAINNQAELNHEILRCSDSGRHHVTPR
jgi:hypothetical protein